VHVWRVFLGATGKLQCRQAFLLPDYMGWLAYHFRVLSCLRWQAINHASILQQLQSLC
jgi:hypothetical protein